MRDSDVLIGLTALVLLPSLVKKAAADAGQAAGSALGGLAESAGPRLGRGVGDFVEQAAPRIGTGLGRGVANVETEVARGTRQATDELFAIDYIARAVTPRPRALPMTAAQRRAKTGEAFLAAAAAREAHLGTDAVNAILWAHDPWTEYNSQFRAWTGRPSPYASPAAFLDYARKTFDYEMPDWVYSAMDYQYPSLPMPDLINDPVNESTWGRNADIMFEF